MEENENVEITQKDMAFQKGTERITPSKDDVLDPTTVSVEVSETPKTPYLQTPVPIANFSKISKMSELMSQVKPSLETIPQSSSTARNSELKREELQKKEYNGYKISYTCLWSPVPLLTTIFPLFGHFSICTSKGEIHDFGNSRFISIDQTNFGTPTKIIFLDLTEEEKQRWDISIENTDKKFKKKDFSFCGNNSMTYVSTILNEVKYKGKSNYSSLDIFTLGICKGKFISFCKFFVTYFGFIFILIIIVIILIACLT